MSNFNKTFEPKTTPKGTELPMMNLKGKPYLQVAHRLVWFREEHPDWTITTELNYDLEKGGCVAKATIGKLADNGTITPIATAHKTETREHFQDYIEKAETGAIGRALALVGYGTQFDPEFDEGDRIVDSPMPVATKKVAPAPTPMKAPAANTPSTLDTIRNAVVALEQKGTMTRTEVSEHIKRIYGVDKSDQLTTTQQQDLLNFLTASLKQGRMN